MCEISKLREQHRWVEAVTALGDVLQTDRLTDNQMIELWLGRNNILLDPLVTRMREGSLPTFQATSDCTNRLLDEKVLKNLVRSYGRINKELKAQIPSLLTALIKVQLSAVKFQEGKADRVNDTITMWWDAMSAIHKAWSDIGSPTEWGYLAEIEEIDGVDQEYLSNMFRNFIGQHKPRTVAYLMIRRMVTALFVARQTLWDFDQERPSAASPALMHHLGGGCVQHLVARRCNEGLPGWYPDPLSLAMVPLDINFLESMKNAWEVTTKSREGIYEQSIRIEFADREVRASALQGASLGATIAAVIQAVCKEEKLDTKICVDAVLDSTDRSLHEVKQLEKKLNAAADEGIHTVIVADEQYAEALDIVNRWNLPISLYREKGFFEAYKRLLVPISPAPQQQPQQQQPPVPPPPRKTAVTPTMIGRHRKVKRLWNERFGKAWWVFLDDQDSRPAILQVIGDGPLVRGTQFTQDVKEVVERLRQMPQATDSLCPTSVEDVPNQPPRIVYERPRDETAKSWSTLPKFLAKLKRSQGKQKPLMDRYELMYIGREVAHQLAELHRNHLVHGEVSAKNVLVQERGGRLLFWLKNAWVSCLPELARQPQPDNAPGQSTLADASQQDIYDFGLFLFELACRRSPTQDELAANADPASDFHVIQNAVAASCGQAWADELPLTLYHVIRECLLPYPDPELRPSADSVSYMLHLAMSDPDFAGGFAETLHGLIQAGRRLFYVESEDLKSLEAGLKQFAVSKRPVKLKRRAIQTDQVEYRLIVAEEERGLRGATHLPWTTQDEVFGQYLNSAVNEGIDPDEVSPPTQDEVAHFNAAVMFAHLEDYQNRLKPGQVSILLIFGIMERGPDWWYSGTALKRHLVRISQERGPAPVIIVAGRRVSLEVDLRPYFVPLGYPPPPLSSVFTWIRQAGRKLERKKFKDDTAVELAMELYPCSKAKLDQELRLCGLKQGRIDETLLTIRDQERKRVIECLGTARYLSADSLPTLKTFGLPEQGLPLDQGFVLPGREEIQQWIQKCRAVQRGGLLVPLKRILLIEGASGCGKNHLAACLAQGLGLPLVRLNLDACLKSDLGGTASAMANTLYAVQELQRAVVLISNADRGLTGLAGDETATAGALARVSGLIQQWIAMPGTSEMILIFTTKKITTQAESSLPSQWQVRLHWRLRLPEPVGAHLIRFREAVFAACFQSRGLDGVADNRPLISRLAHQTDPVLGSPDGASPGTVAAPEARLSFVPRLHGRRIVLQTPREIDAWISETILLHNAYGPPEHDAFWEDAMQGVASDLATLPSG